MILFAGIESLLIGGVCLMFGAWIGVLFARWKEKTAREALGLQEQNILENARREAERIAREAKLAADEEAFKLRQQNETVFTARRTELAENEHRLAHREILLNQQLENTSIQQKQLGELKGQTELKGLALSQKQAQVEDLILQQRKKLESLASLNADEARAELLKRVEMEAAQDANDTAHRIIEEARNRADEKARYIVSIAIQRYSGSLSFDSTTATIALPGDEIKGRIIGREGRNIRAFEHATGVTVLIDDTPNAVVLSGFDPVRREIAREAMSRLIQDGRIHPTRIEEVVKSVSAEIEEAIMRHGEQTIQQVGLSGFHPDIVKSLGKLHYRHSYSQNILQHSVEVAHLSGLIAGELGVDISIAKRAGLLHDIGKALDHESEGCHAKIGADFIKRLGESDVIVKAVAAHHGDEPVDNSISAIVAAADAISASRPGARLETMTTYLRRVEDLEKIGLSFEGVDKCFAVQAGRELRVLVHPNQVDDAQAFALARNIARKIEDELQYPGQIRIIVMRETKCTEVAK